MSSSVASDADRRLKPGFRKVADPPGHRPMPQPSPPSRGPEPSRTHYGMGKLPPPAPASPPKPPVVETRKEKTPPSSINSTDSDSDIINMENFSQILELDEDDTHDFSKGMAFAYFDQAETTFVEMNEAWTGKDLTKLSSLGHFLKGSSAALGVWRVQDTCEKIQHYGELRDEVNKKDISPGDALIEIGVLLKQVRVEYDDAHRWLKDYFKNDEDEGVD